MSYSVEQQTSELGLRMALGAEPQHLLRLVVRQGMTPAGLGVLTGIAIAFAITRVLGSLLYGVKASDPVTFVSVAVLLGAVALGATYVPAKRAMKVDPVIALRSE
jgi:ABC-type antimicrobial peptide transport system permease subunit